MPSPPTTPTSSDSDSALKEILESYIKEFLAFLLPPVHHDIDWRVPPEFLDKELAKAHRRGGLGKRIVDKLVKVRLLSGAEAWILIHVEIQGYADPKLEERVFISNHRIFDSTRLEVVSLVVLTDPSPSYRPCRFERRRWGQTQLLEFPTVKLLDYSHRLEELNADPNPFALVVLAHLEAHKARTDADRLDVKTRLVKMLCERGRGREDIMQLLRFIDWLIALPDDLEDEFDRRVEPLVKEESMPYVTSWERRAERKGEQKGREQGIEQGRELGKEEGRELGKEEGMQLGLRSGLLEAIEIALDLRFGKEGLDLMPRVRAVASVEALRELKTAVRSSAGLEGFAAALARIE
jgi:hypothetical protein